MAGAAPHTLMMDLTERCWEGKGRNGNRIKKRKGSGEKGREGRGGPQFTFLASPLQDSWAIAIKLPYICSVSDICLSVCIDILAVQGLPQRGGWRQTVSNLGQGGKLLPSFPP